MMQKAASEARVLPGGAIASAAASCAPATPSGGIMAHYAASDGRDVPGTSSTYSPTLSPTSSDMCAFQAVGVTLSYGPAAAARAQPGPTMASAWAARNQILAVGKAWVSAQRAMSYVQPYSPMHF